jgi:hypothetical protein
MSSLMAMVRKLMKRMRRNTCVKNTFAYSREERKKGDTNGRFAIIDK